MLRPNRKEELSDWIAGRCFWHVPCIGGQEQASLNDKTDRQRINWDLHQEGRGKSQVWCQLSIIIIWKWTQNCQTLQINRKLSKDLSQNRLTLLYWCEIRKKYRIPITIFGQITWSYCFWNKPRHWRINWKKRYILIIPQVQGNVGTCLIGQVLPQAQEHSESWGALELIQQNGQRVQGPKLCCRQFILPGKTVLIKKSRRKSHSVLSSILRGSQVIKARQER